MAGGTPAVMEGQFMGRGHGSRRAYWDHESYDGGRRSVGAEDWKGTTGADNDPILRTRAALGG